MHEGYMSLQNLDHKQSNFAIALKNYCMKKIQKNLRKNLF